MSKTPCFLTNTTQCDTYPDTSAKDVVENGDAATADGNAKVLEGQKVFFWDLSKRKWKERRIFLESDGSLYYNDKSFIKKRRFKLKLTAFSSVNADPVVPCGTPSQQHSFLLEVVEAETHEQKNSDVFFAFCDADTRNAVQRRLQQAIIDIRRKDRIPNV